MANEIQRVTSKVGSTPTAPTEGVWRLAFGSDTTTDLDFDATVGAIQAALEALSAIGSGNIAANGDLVTGPNYYSTLTFQGALANSNVASIVTYADTLKGHDPTFSPVRVRTTPGVSPVNEVQVIDVADGTGSWTLYKYGGGSWVVVNDIETIDQSGWQTLLDSLWGSGNTAVTGTGPFTVTFQGAEAATNIGLMYFTTNGGSGSPVVNENTDGVAGVNEVVDIDLDGATGGYWDYSSTGNDKALPYNCSAGDVESRIETNWWLPCSVTGSDGVFTITFDSPGPHADLDITRQSDEPLVKIVPITLGLTVVQEGGSAAAKTNASLLTSAMRAA